MMTAQLNMNFMFYLRIFQLHESVQSTDCPQNLFQLSQHYSKPKYEKLAVTVVEHVLQNIQNLVISGCCLAVEDNNEMIKDL